MNKLMLIALLATSPLAMAEEPYRLPDYAAEMHRHNLQMQQENRLNRLEDRQRQEDWDRNNRYYERLREGNERYGKGK